MSRIRTSRLTADVARISQQGRRDAAEARRVADLADKVNGISFAVGSANVPGGLAHQGDAVNHLRVAARELDSTARRTIGYADALRRADQRLKLAPWRSPIADWLLASLAYKGDPAGVTTTISAEGKASFLVIDVEAGISAVITTTEDGKLRIIVTDSVGAGVGLGVGLGVDSSGREIGASAEVSLMLEASHGMIYEVDPDDWELVLGHQIADRLAPGLGGALSELKPVAEFSSGGLSGSASAQIATYEKGGGGKVSVVLTRHRNGSVTTAYVMAGHADLSVAKVGPQGAVSGVMSITRDKAGRVTSVEVSQVAAAAASATRESERPGPEGKPSKTSVGVSVGRSREQSAHLDVKGNSAFQAKLQALVKDPLANNVKIRDFVKQHGVTSTTVTQNTAVTAGGGAHIGAGAKLGVSASVTGSEEVVVSHATRLPR